MKNMFKKWSIIAAFAMTSLSGTVGMKAAPVSAMTCTQTRYSNVSQGYLALRTMPCYDDRNVIYEIWANGTQLNMTGEYSGDYGYCYCPAANAYGWVNVKYTTEGSRTSSTGGNCSHNGASAFQTRYSNVSQGYLALRTRPCYADNNIIYEIWTNGTQLNMTGEYCGDYGYCYCPAANAYGWVNVNYTTL